MRPDSHMPDAETMMHGSLMLLSADRVVLVLDVAQRREGEDGAVVLDELARLFVVALGVALEDVGDVHRERAVDEDGQVGDAAGDVQLVQRVDDLLRAADGEGGDDDLALARDGVVDDLGELRLRIAWMGACTRSP